MRRLVVPERTKLVALLLATFADGDGTRVRPGQRGLIDMVGRSESSVKRAIRMLRDDLGLLEESSHGGGRAATEYRLVVPDDLLERVELLDPELRRARANGSTRRSIQVTQMTSVAAPDPVDNSGIGVTQMTSIGKSIQVTQVTPLPVYWGQKTAYSGHPGDPLPRPTTKEDHNNSDPARPPQREGTPKCIHRMSSARHIDGTPVCVLCRRIAQEVS